MSLLLPQEQETFPLMYYFLIEYRIASEKYFGCFCSLLNVV